LNTAPLLAEAEIKNYHYSPANMKRARLEEFRQVAYKYLGRAKDATFELTDAILLTRNVYSLADLSLSPVFRRKWSSIYEALFRRNLAILPASLYH